jgi:hypothetical protein
LGSRDVRVHLGPRLSQHMLVMKEDKRMGHSSISECIADSKVVEEKSTYEILRDAHVAELAEKLRLVEAAKDEL